MRKFKKFIRIIFVYFSLLTLAVIIGLFLGLELTNRIVPSYDYKQEEFKKLLISDSRFIENKSYLFPGQKGHVITITQNFNLGDFSHKLLSNTYTNTPINEYTFKGALTASELKEYLQDLLDNKTENLRKESDSDKYNGLEVEKVDILETDVFNVDSVTIEIGSVEVFMKNCNFFNTLKLEYNVALKTYQFSDFSEFDNRLCLKYEVPSAPIPTACTDCTFYPVDKKHPLNENYSIEVIAADGVPGGQKFAKLAYGDLLDLYLAAKDAGHNMRLTSAYRSYKDQQEVYEGWVQYEMAFGKSREQAESDANSYSALPGFSEHQLGTTADMSSLDCLGIETICKANENFWEWLKHNAYKFGFVMSYPPGRDNDTGYIHEPWHYRWIGKDLALEFKQKYESRSYPAEFLRNKKLY